MKMQHVQTYTFICTHNTHMYASIEIICRFRSTLEIFLYTGDMLPKSVKL